MFTQFSLPSSKISQTISAISRPKSVADAGVVGSWFSCYQHSGDRTLDPGCAIRPNVLAIR